MTTTKSRGAQMSGYPDGCIQSTHDRAHGDETRRVLPVASGMQLQHIDGNIFNNDRANLRAVTPSKNRGNR